MPTPGNRVGVYRTRSRREVLRLPIPLALATVLGIVLTMPNVDPANRTMFQLTMAGVVVWAATSSLLFACLWGINRFAKVTLFEGGVRGPTAGFRFQTLAWSEIASVERFPLHFQSINPFQSILVLQASGGLPAIRITEPLGDMHEFKEHVRRLAGADHPFARLLDEGSVGVMKSVAGNR